MKNKQLIIILFIAAIFIVLGFFIKNYFIETKQPDNIQPDNISENRVIDIGIFSGPGKGFSFVGENNNYGILDINDLVINEVEYNEDYNQYYRAKFDYLGILAKNKTKVRVFGRIKKGPGVSCVSTFECPDQDYFVLEKIEILKNKK